MLEGCIRNATVASEAALWVRMRPTSGMPFELLGWRSYCSEEAEVEWETSMSLAMIHFAWPAAVQVFAGLREWGLVVNDPSVTFKDVKVRVSVDLGEHRKYQSFARSTSR